MPERGLLQQVPLQLEVLHHFALDLHDERSRILSARLQRYLVLARNKAALELGLDAQALSQDRLSPCQFPLFEAEQVGLSVGCQLNVARTYAHLLDLALEHLVKGFGVEDLLLRLCLVLDLGLLLLQDLLLRLHLTLQLLLRLTRKHDALFQLLLSRQEALLLLAQLLLLLLGQLVLLLLCLQAQLPAHLTIQILGLL